MKSRKRRDVLKTASALLVGGAAVRPAAAAATDAPRTPFTVGATHIPIAGSSDMFPVRRIYCIGRNYAAHPREMGPDPTRESPFFLQKPTDASWKATSMACPTSASGSFEATNLVRTSRMIDSAVARFGTRPREPRRPPAA
jgi:2-keto-4-pentenoate hydratase/2-oxohepta-3-ene-1,7-dioic acid hydratase in catechol pathway